MNEKATIQFVEAAIEINNILEIKIKIITKSFKKARGETQFLVILKSQSLHL